MVGDITHIFNGFCKEDKHSNKLEFFCETHNQLCCLSCIGKDKNIEIAKHKNCKICNIYDIKNDKKNNLDKNIKILEDLSTNINDIIDKSKNIYEKLNNNKEELKAKIQRIMTNIRNKLNEREDKLFLSLESLFHKLCPSEKEIKDLGKIPKKIKALLEKRKDIDKKLEDTFLLNSYINDCINIENDSKEFQLMIDSINKYNQNSEIKVYFFPEETEINKIYNNIKLFGRIYQDKKEIKSFFISEDDKEIKELKEKIKELREEIIQIKDKNKIEYNQLKKNRDDIKNQLDKQKNDNDALSKKLKSSKICFTMRSRCALNKCLDTKNLNYGNSPHLWDYVHNNKNQIFELVNNFNGTYSIKCSASGLYLGFDNDKISFRHRNENSQYFNVYHFDEGYYLFQEKNGGVIDLSNFKTYNGANIGKCPRRNNSNAQQWKLEIHL